MHGLPWGIAAVALAIAVAAISFVLSASSPPGGRHGAFQGGGALSAPPFVTPVAAFAVSPDGQTIRIPGRMGAGGVGRLFTRRLEPARRAAGGRAPTTRACRSGRRTVVRSAFPKMAGSIAPSSTAAHRVDCAMSLDRRQATSVSSSSGTWGARGVIVFASIGAGLFRVPDTGGTPAPVTSLDAANKEVLHASPWFLPDGRHVLFLGLAAGQTRGVIWAVAIDDPARTRIADSSGGAMYADGWLPDDDRGVTARPGGSAIRSASPDAWRHSTTCPRSALRGHHRRHAGVLRVVEWCTGGGPAAAGRSSTDLDGPRRPGVGDHRPRGGHHRFRARAR